MSRKSRTPHRRSFVNTDKQYDDIFFRKKVSFITQLQTPVLIPISNSAVFRTVPHTWKTGDKYYKLAHTYYNDASYWWVIANFNNKPTEGHLNIGDQLLIPVPLSQVLQFL